MEIGKKGLLAGLIGAGFALAGPAALAQAPAAPGWYAGGSLGQSEAKDTDCSPPLTSCDDKDTAWKIFGGYQINRNFAVELGYTNLGEFSASGPGVNASIESKAWEVMGVGSFPVADRFSLYGKLGFYRAESEATSNIPGVSADESNTGLAFGIGAQYDFTRSVAVRAEWQRYSDVGGGNIGETDLDVLSIGALVRF